MNQKIPFHDLSARIAIATGISGESAEQFVKSFFDLLAEAVTAGESVKVKGLGSFNVISANGERTVEFMPDKEITDIINAPFAIFEAVDLDNKLSDDMLRELDKEEVEPTRHDNEPAATAEGAQEKVEAAVSSEGQQPEVSQDETPVKLPETTEAPAGEEEEPTEATPENEPTAENEPTTSPIVSKEAGTHADISLTETQEKAGETRQETEESIAAEATESTIHEQDKTSVEAEADSTNSASSPESTPVTVPTDTKTVTEPVQSTSVDSTPLPEKFEEPKENISVSASVASPVKENVTPEPEPKPADQPTKAVSMPKPLTPFEDEEEEYVRPAAPASGGSGNFWSGLIVGLIVGIALGACGVYLAINYLWPTVTTPAVVETETEEPFSDPLLEEMLGDTVAIATQKEEPAQENTDTVTPAPAEVAQPSEAVAPVVEENPKSATPVKDTVRAGYVMPNMAKKYYGHKDFWVYIYEENKANIANPNNLPVGKVLVIPPAEKYGIDAKNPESLKKAQIKANEILKKYNR